MPNDSRLESRKNLEQIAADLASGKIILALGSGYPDYSLTDASVDVAYALLSQSESKPISDEDKRWRFLEHGCQWVSWTPTGGETVSFDPRDVGHLKAMRAKADETLLAQVKLLREEADRLERRLRK